MASILDSTSYFLAVLHFVSEYSVSLNVVRSPQTNLYLLVQHLSTLGAVGKEEH